jgi:two-component system response regulator NreC
MTVAIIDDDSKCIKRTQEWLSGYKDVSVLFTAINGLDYLQQLQAHKTSPDIVLMDIGMRVMDGCAATFCSKLTQPHIKIIAYTTYNDYDMIRNCFMCGVDGFVMKLDADKVLPDALATVASGNYYFDSNLKYNGFTDVQYNEIINYKKAFWEKPVEILFNITKRERAFIALASTSLTYKEIAELMNIEESTSQQMFSRIAKKLAVRSVKDLATFALQNGLAMQASFLFTQGNRLPY